MAFYKSVLLIIIHLTSHPLCTANDEQSLCSNGSKAVFFRLMSSILNNKQIFLILSLNIILHAPFHLNYLVVVNTVLPRVTHYVSANKGRYCYAVMKC